MAMFDLPDRTALAALTAAVRAVLPAPALGFVRGGDDGEVHTLFLSNHGIACHVVPAADMPANVWPGGDGRTTLDAAALAARPESATEWQLTFYGVRQVISMPVPGVPATRFWVGADSPAALAPAVLDTLSTLAAGTASILQAEVPAIEQLERLQRLDRAADLGPALLQVLDVRDVFTHLSATARRALPHDLLLLRQFSDDMTTVTVYALSDRGPVAAPPVSHGYPVSIIRAWEYSIVDDLAAHPIETEAPLTRLGARSVLRLSIKFDHRTIGGLAFLSFRPGAYTSTDLAVARRLAGHVAGALSHEAMARRLAAEARSHEQLRALTTSLDMLDQSLNVFIEQDPLPEAFGRICGVARAVLPHDAAALLVRLPDNVHARRYAGVGLPDDLPEVSEIPPEVLASPDWDHAILNDLAARTSPGSRLLVAHGFRSLLQVSLRHDERFAGALLFYARTPEAFSDADVPFARRIADRMAITLARNRELDAERRAGEAVERAARLEARVRALTDELDARTGYRRVIGESKQWRHVLTQATQVAATETTALLLGESGTGKEVIARFIHRASPRSGGPYVALNCAALPEQLLEAELFGYERGAFTGAVQSKPGQLELAAGGTLFLDEVGEMSLVAQAKFLRVLQEREFQRLGGTRVLRSEARIVAATNRDLPRAIAQGQFREDLYYRLNVFAIRLPALRDRRDDILPLADAFLTEVAKGLGRPPGGISRDARQALFTYAWPGNVRELRNTLERAAILCEGGLITAELLALPAAGPDAAAVAVPAAVSTPAAVTAPAATPPAPGPAAPASADDLAAIEKTMIEQALTAARFNKSKAATALGMTRHQLYIRMRRHGLE
jgi:transcriptional regulator with GAF, ATPase, and Fis domain